VQFESGDLRYLRLGQTEIVRRIYVAVRDQNWGTVAARLSDVEVDEWPQRFAIRYTAEHVEGPIDFLWRAEVEGNADGSLRFVMDGLARSSFLRNRIGFCVLHPIRECAGARCRLIHADGTTRETAFPRLVAARNPFLELAGLAHEVEPGLWAELRFESEIFETEDQRNWMDGSFKTFCTPLRLPFPVEIRAGDRIRQVVTLRLTGAPSSLPASSGPPTLRIGRELAGKVPEIGLGIPAMATRIGAAERQRLQTLAPSHLLVDLDLWQDGWTERFTRALAEAEMIGSRLDLSFATGDDSDAEGELARLAEATKPWRSRIGSWQVFSRASWSTPLEAVERARRILAAGGDKIRLVAGTRANFLELNRDPPRSERIDAVCFSAHPQEHAFDNRSLVENLDGLASVVESARVLAGGLPLEVGPITLKKRLNPYATGPAPQPLPGELPARVDVRQMSLFGAAWTLGAVKRLAEGGVERATFYETIGWLGVMEDQAGPRLPDLFPSRPGQVFPLFHVLADVNGHRGADVLPSRSSDPLALDGLVVKRGNSMCVLVANYSPETTEIRIEGLGKTARIRRHDAASALQDDESARRFRAEKRPILQTDRGTLSLSMTPYCVARIDTE
jgi:hypothetical protein